MSSEDNFGFLNKFSLTFNEFLDLVQRHHGAQLRGDQWTVSTPPLKDSGSIRGLLS